MVADAASSRRTPRFGAEVLSPASRLRRKKEKLKAFSTAGAVDEKIQNGRRRKRILQEEAVTSKRELQDMALEEAWHKSKGLCVRRPRHGLHLQGEGVSTRLQLFLNQRRDYMLVCTRAAQHETYEPVLVSEAELARAVTAYNKGKKLTLSKTGTEAEDWALHYLFKCVESLSQMTSARSWGSTRSRWTTR